MLRMVMENRGAEGVLNLSERESSAWVHLWHTNFTADAAFNFVNNGLEPDLSAIGDKEIAAKAVAFVVSSSRKGIVPLCADVANLLRAKRSLEEQILRLTRENTALRQGNVPEACSPTTSLVTDSSRMQRSTSVCSSSSRHSGSLAASSEVRSLPEYSFMPVSPASASSPCCKGALLQPTPTTDLPLSGIMPTSENGEPTPCTSEIPLTYKQTSGLPAGLSCDRCLNQGHRSHSLCSERLAGTPYAFELHTRLSAELTGAKATIAVLQRQLRDQNCSNKNNSSTMCDEEHCNEEQMSLCVDSSKGCSVCLNDRILTSSNLTGCVRFIGHLDGFSPHCVFLGLELLSEVHGGHDGSFNGKKYFTCSKGHGLFIQTSDVVSVLPKQEGNHNQETFPSYQRKSNGSKQVCASGSSSSDSTPGLVSKLCRKAARLRHTLSDKRIVVPVACQHNGTMSSQSTPSRIADPPDGLV